MPTLNHRALFLGSLRNLDVDVEVLRLESSHEFPENLDLASIEVVLADLEDLSGTLLSRILKLQFPRVAQIIAVLTEPDRQLGLLSRVQNELRLFAAVPVKEVENARDLVLRGLEASHKIRQRIDLQKLLDQQDRRLRTRTVELEKSAQHNQLSLAESRRKNLISKYRWEVLKQALEAIHQSSSIPEIESNLAEVLQQSMKLRFLKIHFAGSERTLSDSLLRDFSYYSVTLFRSNENPMGMITFFRDQNIPFLKEEKEFLGRITDAVTLAIDRVQQLELAETFREQWQATFNAVSEPVALISKDFNILQANSAFHQRQPAAAGKKCYERLFQRSGPCIGCHLGTQFRLTENVGSFKVYSQKSLQDPVHGEIYVNHYQDISEQVRIERKMAESAKLAELGTIGSSIAHELNNPLGGLISFLQLIKMDLSPQDPILADIEEMEKGALRCKEIVQNLLGFTRSSAVDGAQKIDLRAVINKVTGILNLQLKSRGSSLHFVDPGSPLWIQGHPNLLAQAFMSLIQSYFLGDNTKSSHIEIAIRVSDLIEVHLLENDRESRTRTEVQPASLSISQQIFKDHHCILSQDNSDNLRKHVKISFPLDLDKPEVQV